MHVGTIISVFGRITIFLGPRKTVADDSHNCSASCTILMVIIYSTPTALVNHLFPGKYALHEKIEIRRSDEDWLCNTIDDAKSDKY